MDTDATEGELSGPFDEVVLEGLTYDLDTGAKGWPGLEAQAASEDDVIALAYTSGTTARPKGVEYTHRGCYLAAMGNVIESGLNSHRGRCRYLWTLPMFHACGWCSLLGLSCDEYLQLTLFQGGRSLGLSRQCVVPITACGRLTTRKSGSC